MKVIRKQIGIRIEIDQEDGQPIVKPVYETVIQKPIWKIVLGKMWAYYLVTGIYSACLIQSVNIASSTTSALWGLLVGINTGICIMRTYETIKQNS